LAGARWLLYAPTPICTPHLSRQGLGCLSLPLALSLSLSLALSLTHSPSLSLTRQGLGARERLEDLPGNKRGNRDLVYDLFELYEVTCRTILVYWRGSPFRSMDYAGFVTSEFWRSW
jgi:hypothetical protein